VRERADAGAGPPAGVARVDDQVDELGVQGVELPDDDGEAFLEIVGRGGSAHDVIVHVFAERIQHVFDDEEVPRSATEGLDAGSG